MEKIAKLVLFFSENIIDLRSKSLEIDLEKDEKMKIREVDNLSVPEEFVPNILIGAIQRIFSASGYSKIITADFCNDFEILDCDEIQRILYIGVYESFSEFEKLIEIARNSFKDKEER